MAGIAFMDNTEPGWRSRIDGGSLDIKYDCGCVVGQVYGSFNANMGKGRLLETYKQAADLGFYAYSHGTSGADAEYAALTKAWLDILAAEDSARRLTQRVMYTSERIAIAA